MIIILPCDVFVMPACPVDRLDFLPGPLLSQKSYRKILKFENFSNIIRTIILNVYPINNKKDSKKFRPEKSNIRHFGLNSDFVQFQFGESGTLPGGP